MARRALPLEPIVATLMLASLVACSGDSPRPLHPSLPTETEAATSAPGADFSGSGLVAALEATGRHDMFVLALERAGFATQLAREDDYTVLAPTDTAFAQLGEETRTWLFAEANRGKLVELVTNHLLRGRVREQTLRQPEQPIETIAGNALSIAVDQTIWIGAARVSLPPIEAENGLVYSIDRVLLPL